jgi:hypothetical protein
VVETFAASKSGAVTSSSTGPEGKSPVLKPPSGSLATRARLRPATATTAPPTAASPRALRTVPVTCPSVGTGALSTVRVTIVVLLKESRSSGYDTPNITFQGGSGGP